MKKSHSISLGVIVFLCLSALIAQSSLADHALGGIGIIVSQLFDPKIENKIGSLVVLKVFNNTPAEKQGVEKGDIITHINGEPTAGEKFMKLVSEKLRGPISTSLEITIWRTGEEKPFNLKLKREKPHFLPKVTDPIIP